MIATGTAIQTHPDCSTGCPTCGCCNPSCYYAQPQPWRLFSVQSVHTSELAEDIDALRAAVKRATPRPWVAMKQAPRRFGRQK